MIPEQVFRFEILFPRRLLKSFPELIFQEGTDDPPLVSRTVELTEKNILPAGKPEFSTDDRNCFRGTDQTSLEVGVSVPVLLVMQPDSPGNEFLQEMDDIGSNTRIPVFLDHDRCGCSLGIEGDQSVTDAAGLDTGFHFQGNVDQFFPSTGGDGNGVFHDFLERK